LRVFSSAAMALAVRFVWLRHDLETMTGSRSG
jgi:hypothetical protein